MALMPDTAAPSPVHITHPKHLFSILVGLVAALVIGGLIWAFLPRVSATTGGVAVKLPDLHDMTGRQVIEPDDSLNQALAALTKHLNETCKLDLNDKTVKVSYGSEEAVRQALNKAYPPDMGDLAIQDVHSTTSATNLNYFFVKPSGNVPGAGFWVAYDEGRGWTVKNVFSPPR